MDVELYELWTLVSIFNLLHYLGSEIICSTFSGKQKMLQFVVYFLYAQDMWGWGYRGLEYSGAKHNHGTPVQSLKYFDKEGGGSEEEGGGAE